MGLMDFLLQSKVSKPLQSAALDGEDLVDEGPDDLWPAEPETPRLQAVPDQPLRHREVFAVEQWGLRLPSGEIAWSVWQNAQLNEPMERVQLIANLQHTALDIGLAVGEQADEFLSHYEWVTRTQICSVVYEDTGTYSLTDPKVSALGAPVTGEPDVESRDDPAAPEDPDGDVHQGPVGGDAQ